MLSHCNATIDAHDEDNMLLAVKMKKRALKILNQLNEEKPNWKVIKTMAAKLDNHLFTHLD